MHGMGDMRGRGCAWQGVYMAGAMHGMRACVEGGMHGRGCLWQGVYMAGGHAWHTVNERAVHILLECILVFFGGGGGYMS